MGLASLGDLSSNLIDHSDVIHSLKAAFLFGIVESICISFFDTTNSTSNNPSDLRVKTLKIILSVWIVCRLNGSNYVASNKLCVSSRRLQQALTKLLEVLLDADGLGHRSHGGNGEKYGSHMSLALVKLIIIQIRKYLGA